MDEHPAAVTGPYFKTICIYAVTLLLLLTVCISIYQYTVKLREPAFGYLGGGNQAVTSESVMYARNWYRDGILHDRFGLLRNPSSIEFPTLKSRSPYASYPPGTTLLLCLYSKIKGEEPSVPMIMEVNLKIHFCVALLASISVLLILSNLSLFWVDRIALSIVPMLLVLLLPGPLHWQQNCFFANQAVLLPFIFYILLEVIADKLPMRSKYWKWIRAVQEIVMLCGILIDYLFYCFAPIVYIRRCVRGEMGKRLPEILSRSCLFWTPVLIGALLFVFEIVAAGSSISELKSRFLQRSALSAEGASVLTKDGVTFFQRFWPGHVGQGFGWIAPYLLLGSLGILTIMLLFALWRTAPKKPARVQFDYILDYCVLLCAPNVVYLLVLRHQCYQHQFTALYFLLPLAMVSFVLLPILLLSPFILLISPNWPGRTARLLSHSPLVGLCILMLTIMYVRREEPRYVRDFADKEKPIRSIADVGSFVGGNTLYEDVVFSDSFEIPAVFPTYLCYSMKRVYKVSGLSEMERILRPIESEYTLCFLTNDYDFVQHSNDIRDLLLSAFDFRVQKAVNLYKIRKTDFLRKCEKTRLCSKEHIDFESLTYLGNALLSQGKSDEAHLQFTKAADSIQKLRSINAEFIEQNEYQFLCYDYLMLGETEKAIQEGESARSEYPASVEIAYLLASGYFRKGSIESARTVILSLPPDMADRERLVLCHLLQESGKSRVSYLSILQSSDKAKNTAFLRTVTERMPGSPEAWIALGQTLASSNFFSEAETSFRHALDLSGNSLLHFRISWSLLGWVDVLCRLNKGDEAFGRLSESLAFFGRPSELLFRYCVLGKSLKRLSSQEVLALTDEAIQKGDGLGKAWKTELFLFKASTLVLLNRADEARQVYMSILDINPDHQAAKKAIAEIDQR